jgi:hypothetical protein
MSSRVAPDAIHSKIISTLIRVPRIVGLPLRMVESDVMRSNMRASWAMTDLFYLASLSSETAVVHQRCLVAISQSRNLKSRQALAA